MRIDFGTVLGGAVAVLGIGVGLAVEGGSLTEILQPTAALIVFGGTAGATLVSQPLQLVQRATIRLLSLWLDHAPPAAEHVQSIVQMALKARQHGILAIDGSVEGLQDPFLRRILRMGIDGVEPGEIESVATLDLEREADESDAAAGVLDSAGGFAPTIGILGAVLGLIQVMKHLEDIDEVGAGIAVAFVATIYGVALANLVLLPGAKKIRIRAERLEQVRRMQLDGALLLIRGRNPRLIRDRLEAYLGPPSGRSLPPAEPPPAEDAA